MDNECLKRSSVRFCLLMLAAVLALALTTSRTAFAGPAMIEALGGTTDSDSDNGNIVIGGLVVIKGTTVSSLNITIAYEDNFVDTATPTSSFICTLTNPADFVFSGGLPVQAATITISATGDKCFQTINPTVTFSNATHSLTFRSYTIGGRTRFKSTSSTLVNGDGETIGNVAIAGEVEPSGSGSTQATGVRMISGFGGAVDTDDSGSLSVPRGQSGHIALAGLITLNPLKKGATTGTAKAVDVTLDYQDFFFTQSLACHLITPADVTYTLVKGVGTLTITVGSSGECPAISNTGNFIKFALYVGGSSGRIVSTSSTLVDSDGEAIVAPAVVGEFSTSGGS